MSETQGDEIFVPEINWRQTLIWRGATRTTDRNEADRAAQEMVELLVPTVTDTGQPALEIAVADGERPCFALDISIYDYRSEFLTPLRRACQVVAEMGWQGELETGWESAVISGDHVIWRPWWRTVQYTRRDLAQERAADVLMNRLRPAASKHWQGETWDAVIEHRADSGEIDVERIIKDGETWPTRADAWRYAAEVLAAAEATARQAPDRTPVVTWPEPDSPTPAASQAA